MTWHEEGTIPRRASQKRCHYHVALRYKAMRCERRRRHQHLGWPVLCRALWRRWRRRLQDHVTLRKLRTTMKRIRQRCCQHMAGERCSYTLWCARYCKVLRCHTLWCALWRHTMWCARCGHRQPDMAQPKRQNTPMWCHGRARWRKNALWRSRSILRCWRFARRRRRHSATI